MNVFGCMCLRCVYEYLPVQFMRYGNLSKRVCYFEQKLLTQTNKNKKLQQTVNKMKLALNNREKKNTKKTSGRKDTPEK